MKGQLLLLPNLLNKEEQHPLFLPKSVDDAVSQLQGIVAESEKEARHFLKRFAFAEGKSFRDIPIALLNEHTVTPIDELLAPLRKGEIWGLISDVGLPILADPGSQLVRRAYDFGIIVKTFVGPSSIIQALMLSGLPAQRFAFHGYLPKHGEKFLIDLEKRSKMEGSTHIFIEAPYRNDQMLGTLLNTLSDETVLCVAWDLTFPTQGLVVHPVHIWRKRALPSLHKRPAIFLFAS